MEKMQNNVAVLMPIYRPLTEGDLVAIRSVENYVPAYPRYFCTPDHVKVSRNGWQHVKFASHHFANVRAYSRFMLNPIFYQAFTKYDWILLVQTDAVLLKPGLDTWITAHSSLDYVGAPWKRSLIGWCTAKNGIWQRGGNGGLSLRKVSSCLSVLHSFEDQTGSVRPLLNTVRYMIQKTPRGTWLETMNPQDYLWNEDGFWSFEASKYVPSFRPANIKDMIQFSWEMKPSWLYAQTGALPYGCHAWKKYEPSFWQQRVAELSK